MKQNKFEVFQVNENDNLLSAVGKGMFNGAYQAYVVWGAIGIGCILVGQTVKKVKGKEVETEKEEVGE